MVAIDTQRDFLRLLREDPEFKDEVRRLILTEELLNLPARVTVIEGEVKEIRKELVGINRRLDGMDGRLDGMDGRMDGMDGRMDRMSDDIAYLKGETMELRMVNRIVSIMSDKLKLRRGILLKGGPVTSAPTHDFEDAVYDAFEQGAITERERGRVNDTDAVIRAICRDTGLRVYVAIEASFVIDDGDVDRAHRTSKILSKVFPKDLTASAVYGDSINSAGSDMAEELGVAVHLKR